MDFNENYQLYVGHLWVSKKAGLWGLVEKKKNLFFNSTEGTFVA